MKVIHLIYNHYPGSIPQALVHYQNIPLQSLRIMSKLDLISTHFGTNLGYSLSILHFKNA